MLSALSARSLVYGLVWAGTLRFSFQLAATGAVSGRLLLPDSLALLLGFVSGGLFDWLSRKYHWLLPAILLGLLHIELVAWIGQHGPLALQLLPPTILTSIFAPIVARRVREPKPEELWPSLAKLLAITFVLIGPKMFGDNMSGLNTVHTMHRTTSPDGLWAARVKRGGPLFGPQVDAVVARPDRDWFGLFTLRIAEAPLNSIEGLRWSDDRTLVSIGEPLEKSLPLGLRLTAERKP
jgi:branched-subunit amino acid transport protein